jgi:hypothetical protein
VALVPYDAAPNHEPYKDGGRSAHWALVRGLVLRLPAASPVAPATTEVSAGASLGAVLGAEASGDDGLSAAVRSAAVKDEKEADLWHWLVPPPPLRLGAAAGEDTSPSSVLTPAQQEIVVAAEAAAQAGRLFVLAQQGKSKLQAAWAFEALRASNANLVEFNPKRTDEAELYVFPADMSGLRGHAVFLDP